MIKLVAPSILSADFSNIGQAVELAEKAGADLIHVDIMDGHFVPNLTLGPGLVAAIRKRTRLPIDVHLMVENPRAFVPPFHEAGADWISLHVEATAHLHKDVTMIRELGRKAGVALNPGTPIETLREVLGSVDFVLLMSVDPGWGGQSFIPRCLDKIRDLKSWLREEGLAAAVEVDGGLKLDNLEEAFRAGMDIAVAGSAIFEAPDPAAVIRAMKSGRSFMGNGPLAASHSYD
jgi:ribulose-phosphate 3-epimerase